MKSFEVQLDFMIICFIIFFMNVHYFFILESLQSDRVIMNDNDSIKSINHG